MVGSYEIPTKMSDIEGWQRHRDIVLEKWEREGIFALDRAFRNSYFDVIQYHQRRPVVKALTENKGKDWAKANGGRSNPSI